MVMLSAKVQCSPTTAATSDTQTPDTGTTPVAGATQTQTGNITTPVTPNQQGGSNSGPRIVMIVGSVVVLLLIGLGAGWFYFRRMLMPQGATTPNLPPSGARPWSRTRVPNPDSVNGLAGVQNAPGPGGPGGPLPEMLAGTGNLPPGQNGYNSAGAGPAGFGPQGANGNGFGGFSDGFIPPSPQIFPQSENSMIPPGSGAFPVINNANGFAPASQAFNAMYGLPDDPFAGSQAGAPGWMSNLGSSNGHGNGFENGQSPQGGSVPPGQVDLNDPQLDEVIRQYSQKSQSLPPPPPPRQMSPNGPPLQMSPSGPPQQMSPAAPPPRQMSPNGPPSQMPPGRPARPMGPGGAPSLVPLNGSVQQMSPNGPVQQMSPNGPPSQMPPNGPVQQMSPNGPPSQIPQREPRTGFQDSHWLK
jgi:hypothetical protein